MKKENTENAVDSVLLKIAETGDVTENQLLFLNFVSKREKTGMFDSIKLDKNDITEVAKFVISFMGTKK